jgi:hypothetical protein
VVLLLFDRKGSRDEEYRIFLSAENLDLWLGQQQDFRDLHDGKTIANTQHSIGDFAERIKRDLQELGIAEVWFLDRNKLQRRVFTDLSTAPGG